MKFNHFIITGCLFTAFSLQSCIKEKDLYQAPPTTYSELNLKIDGDYFLTELPLTRATSSSVINESKTILGIAISMTPKEGVNPPSKPYAYGIFQLDKAKNPDNLKIRVIDGYNYRISCSMIANAKDSINTVGDAFEAPFDLDRAGKEGGECLNKFTLAEQLGVIKFLYNIESSKIKTKNKVQNEYSRPFIERYHGTIDKIDVTDGAENTIKLYRRFFGVNFKQTGLESGFLRIKMEDSPDIYLYANGDIHQTVESGLKMVSMKNLTASLPTTPQNSHLTENVKVEVFWTKVPGGDETLIINNTITFKRNFAHNIVLTNIDHIGTPGNIGIEVEGGEMGEVPDQDIPWQ